MNRNIARVEQLTTRMMAILKRWIDPNPGLSAPKQEMSITAGALYWQTAIQNLAQVFDQQVAFWGASLQNFMKAQSVDTDADAAPVATFNRAADSRCDHPVWDANPYSNQIKRQYLLNVTTLCARVSTLDELSSVEKQRLNYFCMQIIDMMSPTNFLATNPAALEKAFATQGQ